MLLGFFFFGVADMLAKVVTQDLDPLQVAWFRQIGLAVGVFVTLVLRGFVVLRSRRPLLQIARGLCVVVATAGFLSALPYVPLADATAVGFIAPFIVVLLSAVFLGEPVGLKRWLAVLFCFVGTAIIVRPGTSAFQPATLLLLLSATAFAARQVIARFLASSDRLSTTVAYTGLTAVFVFSIPLPLIWHSPETPIQIALLIGISCAAGCGEVLMIRALDLGEAAMLSPLQYTIIIWTTLWGYLIFSDLPDIWTWLGIGIIVASGLYSLHLEPRLRTEAPHPPA